MFSLIIVALLTSVVSASAQSPADVLHRDYYVTAVRQQASLGGPETILVGDSIAANLALPGVLNLGIPGDTTAGAVNRLTGHPALRTAKTVILEGGVNDIGFGAKFDTDIVSNYRNLLQIAAGKRVLILGVLPVDEAALSKDFAGYNRRIADVNANLRALCAATVGCRFVETRLRPEHYRDGIHPNDAGNEALIAALREHHVK